jgi:hypothetical protein
MELLLFCGTAAVPWNCCCSVELLLFRGTAAVPWNIGLLL